MIARSAMVLFLFAALILAAGALLAWPLQLLLSIPFEPRFHKTVHYTTVLLALGLGLGYLRACRRLSGTLGLDLDRGQRRRMLLRSFLAGVLILLAVESCIALLGMRQMDPDLAAGPAAFLLALGKALISGCLVAAMEEALYRGAVYTGLERHGGTSSALLLSSLIYAAVHFIELPEVAPGSPILWMSGPVLLAQSFAGFADPFNLDSFLTLFLLGGLLAMVRARHGNIIPCIGIHAGVVSMNKIMSYATDYRPGSTWDFLVNRYDHRNGILASACLLLACAFYHQRNKRPDRGETAATGSGTSRTS